MSKIVRWVASATLGLLVGSLLLTSAAQAQDKTPEPEWFGVNYVESHEWEPELSVELKNCTFTVQANDIPYHVSSEWRTAGLAIRVDGETVAYTEPKEMEDGPHTFDGSLSWEFAADAELVEFRWFAGPDRDDLPAWKATGPADGAAWDAVVNEINTRMAADPDREHWDARDDAEFVNWYTYDGEVTGCTPPSESLSPEASKSPEADDSCELVDQLDVAEEQREGYDRIAKFGNGYDRQGLLDASLTEHGDYYSTWDDTHYTDASDVDVDHTVSLAEAWDSGAYSWTQEQRVAFTADLINLTLLTDEVNQAKKDRDFAEWVPSVSELLDEYLLTYVQVKVTYGLSVDTAEQDALLEAAVELGLCDDESSAPGVAGGSDDEQLPATGASLPLITGIGAGLLGVGVGLFFLARRRRSRYHFTA